MMGSIGNRLRRSSMLYGITRNMSTSKAVRRTTKLKRMLQSPDLEFIMEAHSGLSAKIVEETGFKGIWGSGLSISAQLGVRDSNEASWTQVLDVVEFMSDAAKNTPILLDSDTGFGNFNNARRLVTKLEERGVAGCCMEDKAFPKTNSLHDEGRPQALAAIDEFALKITACKDSQRDPDFCVVARLEAFITGLGLEEAFTRASAYAVAGADAILCHSKRGDHDEVKQFMARWKSSQHKNVPVVIVPTKYYKTPTQEFRDLGVSLVIWANHNLRSSVQAMQSTTQQIYAEQNLVGVENKIVSVKEIFRLQNEAELELAEKKYLPGIKR